MNLNQLEYFIAVAENLNFTKAAEKCFITQTAMSQQIHSLEQIVGVPLLVRDKHHVELTAAGKIYLNEARSIVDRSNTAIRLARTTSEGITGSICIGYIRGCVHDYLSGMIRGFHQLYPKVSISFYRDNMNGVTEALENGTCDVSFNLTTHTRASAHIEHRFFAAYQLMAVVYEGHSFFNRTAVKYSEMSREDFIIMQPSGRPKDEAEEVLVAYERGGFVPNIIASEPEPETLLLMVSSGMGISVLPEYIIGSHTLEKSIRAIPILKEDGSSETLDLEFSWKPDSLNPVVAKFAEGIIFGSDVITAATR